MIKTRNTLPTEPSQLIATALRDLEKIEADEDYKVYMGTWHEPNAYSIVYNTNEKCAVCLAGAVMAKTFKVPIDENATPTGSWMMAYSSADRSGLAALDYFRVGDINHALWLMGLQKPEGIAGYHYGAPDYEDDKEAFKTYLKNLSKTFEKHGL